MTAGRLGAFLAGALALFTGVVPAALATDMGYKYDTFNPHPWMYLDLDLAQRRGGAK